MGEQNPQLVHEISREAFKLMEDETRRRIVFMLRDEPLSVKQISERLDLTPQNIYHHMNKLQDADIVELNYERKKGHLIESYYTTTAENFIFSEDKIPELPTQSFVDILNGLNELGFHVDVSLENAGMLEELHSEYSDTVEIENQLPDLCRMCSFSGFFMKFGPMNPYLLNRLYMYASLIKMSDSEFQGSMEKLRKIRNFLKSKTMDNPTA
jgi:DNA-binding transcriptional ArsR family regulator